MKKFCSCVLALTITLLSVAAMLLPASAEGGGWGVIPDDVVLYEENGFEYTLLSDDTAMITNFPEETHIVIPDTLGGHTVTEIAGWDFYDCPALVSSETVSMSLPGSLRALGGETFYDAYALTEFIVRPGNTAFSVDANGVLFSYDKTELICYPAAMINAEYSVPEGTRKISNEAFNSDPLNLKHISLPASLESFNAFMFSYCHQLESITVSKNNPFYSAADGVLFNKEKTVLYVYPCQSPRTTYYIPNTVTELAHGAFSYSSHGNRHPNRDMPCTLTAVYIPNSVQSIDGSPFILFTQMGMIGYIDPIEPLTVYCETGSPLQAYCAENGIACAQWDGKAPTRPEETKPEDANPTAPSDNTVASTKPDGDNPTADKTAVDIPKTAGSVHPAAAGAVTMLAFSAAVFLRRKKYTV